MYSFNWNINLSKNLDCLLNKVEWWREASISYLLCSGLALTRQSVRLLVVCVLSLFLRETIWGKCSQSLCWDSWKSWLVQPEDQGIYPETIKSHKSWTKGGHGKQLFAENYYNYIPKVIGARNLLWQVMKQLFIPSRLVESRGETEQCRHGKHRLFIRNYRSSWDLQRLNQL